MSSSQRIKLGRWGEQIAADYLRNLGYTVLGTNLRTPFGEIDIVASQGKTLVFVEVKTRKSSALGLPEISITPKKFSHMLLSAQSYLLGHSEATQDWRIDVISIRHQPEDQPPEIVQFENVNDVR
jgi:putative endonuclease